jgi:predicted transcriptional regulator
MRKRDKITIIYDILKILKESRRPLIKTRILYKSRLAHPQMKEYLNTLIKDQLIIQENDKYNITEKGHDYVNWHEKCPITL